MKATLSHIEINTSNLKFYKELLTYLGYKIIREWDNEFGASDGSTDMWVTEVGTKYKGDGFHRKRIGLNHLAVRVSSKDEVDQFYKEYLQPKNIAVLYGGPKEYPEYVPGYYAVYFEDPDRIKLEVTYEPRN